MSERCSCHAASHEPRLVVLTGGPGAGKTAVLEIARQHFCDHVSVLPEAAGIVYGGGFPRKPTDAARRMAQRSIFHVERALEDLALEERTAAVALCDRGTLDGLAYWPDTVESFMSAMGTSLERELGRYAAVIHLRTPSASEGYNHVNVLRIESATEAHVIDERIASVWERHPRRFVVDNQPSFFEKAARAMAILLGEIPPCCRARVSLSAAQSAT